jgi:hypothetical protein
MHPAQLCPSPLHLSPEDKLGALRRLDRYRTWQSLDDQRLCLGCGEMITGREIQIDGGTRGHGVLRAFCPTEGCSAVPMDWTLAAGATTQEFAFYIAPDTTERLGRD